ncbi:MAG: hypothetical protein WCO79_02570 [bacterium]
MKHTCTCPECKNEVDLSAFPNIVAGHVVECNVCGISLLVLSVDEDGKVDVEIADEGK